ncbi:hypothetical protein QYE76_055399 [Lolium multiflorum]|uniref:Transposase (putative) gypsy type domain-containing protein n=1 Tax=Lolium multiflorum TaxID=4521 RepID=A0AAD8WPF1_LOLMU|nr:hypothetical protein QYE76_055399 [Lolium multiflorum]
MPPRTKLTKHTTPGTNPPVEHTEISGWERSKISNQDLKTLKTLGLLKKEEALIFPGEESFPTPRIGYRVTFVDHLIRGLSTPIHEFLRGLLFVYGIQLHQLTPKSILHISIFITLCECFLGTHHHWGLWKRIFYLRRNSSRNVAYNVDGVVICVRLEVDYFDVKFPDSVQGWRRRWLYIQEKDVDSQEYNIAPFDGAAKILRRQSWDAEATDEERTATDALMKRIHELQNTHGKELSGVQITAHFLRIRVQPLQARKNPLWITIKLFLLFLPFLRVERWMSEPSLLTSRKNPLILNLKSRDPANPRLPLKKDTETEAYESVRSPPSAVSSKNKRKRGETEDSGSSKPAEPAPEESSPEDEGNFDPYDDAGSVSSGEKEEEEGPAILGTAPTSTSNTVVLSEENRAAADSSPPPQQIVDTSTPPSIPRAPSPKILKTGAGDEQTLILGSSSTPMMNDPLMDQFIRIGSQSIGFRNEAHTLKASLQRAEECAEALEAKLKLSEEAREKAEADATSVEDLRHRLTKAETALSDKIAEQITREQGIIDWLEAQSQSFFRRSGTHQSFQLKDCLHAPLPSFFPKQTEPEIFTDLVKGFLPNEDLVLPYRRENLKIGVEGTIALVANSDQQVDWAKAGDAEKINKDKWKALVKDAKPHSNKIIAFFTQKSAGCTSTAKTEVK